MESFVQCVLWLKKRFECTELPHNESVFEQINALTGPERTDKKAVLTLLGFIKISHTHAEYDTFISSAKSYVQSCWPIRVEFLSKLNLWAYYRSKRPDHNHSPAKKKMETAKTLVIKVTLMIRSIRLAKSPILIIRACAISILSISVWEGTEGAPWGCLPQACFNLRSLFQMS